MEMKKILYIVAAALAIASCSKEMNNGTSNTVNTPETPVSGKEVCIQVGFATKASVNDATGAMVWEEGDAIGVFTGSGFTKFTVDASTLSDQFPVFKGSLEDGQTLGNIAVYPFGIAGETDGSSIGLVLPAAWDEYSATNARAIMLATNAAEVPTGDGTTITRYSFKHLGGGVKISLSDVNVAIDKIIVTVPGKKIAGSYTISAADTELQLANASTAEESAISFSLPIAAERTSEASFYIPFPVGEIAGLNIKAVTADGGVLVDKTAGETISIGRTDIYSLRTLPVKVLGGGMGTSSSPFLISSKEDLLQLQEYSNDTLFYNAFKELNYKQTADIDLASVVNFTPLFNSAAEGGANPFGGIYDGDSKIIENLAIASTTEYAGLFGVISAGTVKNVVLQDSDVSSSVGKLGSIAGTVQSYGLIDNCKVTGSVASSSGWGFGGISGVCSTRATIENCSFTGSVTLTETAERAGGIVGHLSRGSVENCEVLSGSSVTSAAHYVGGIAGYWKSDATNFKSISGCNVNATLTSAADRVGGIVAYAFNEANNPVTISDCTVQGNFSGTTYVAGILGYLYQGDFSISGCSVLNGTTITGTSNCGGIIGLVSYTETITGNTEVTDCTFKGSLNGASNLGGVIGSVVGGTTDKAIDASITVKDCYVSGSITGTGQYIGGVTGISGSVKHVINNCYSCANIQAAYSTGGILGCHNNSLSNTLITVLNCAYVGGTITATSKLGGSYDNYNVGGIVGWFRGSSKPSMINNYSRPQALAATTAGATKPSIGGLLGYKNGGGGKYTTVRIGYSDLTEAKILVAGSPVSGGTLYGGVIGQNTAGSSSNLQYLNWLDTIDGSGTAADNTTYLVEANHCGALTAAQMTDGTLLANLNAGRTAYNASAAEDLQASQWIAGADGYPTLAGLPTGD